MSLKYEPSSVCPLSTLPCVLSTLSCSHSHVYCPHCLVHTPVCTVHTFVSTPVCTVRTVLSAGHLILPGAHTPCPLPTLLVTQEQILSQSPVAIDGFLSQLPYKCHKNRVASVGFAPGLPPGWILEACSGESLPATLQLKPHVSYERGTPVLLRV